MKKCTICGEPIVLSPSAAQRAESDASGRPASFFTNLFTQHGTCTVAKRSREAQENMARAVASAARGEPVHII